MLWVVGVKVPYSTPWHEVGVITFALQKERTVRTDLDGPKSRSRCDVTNKKLGNARIAQSRSLCYYL
jgi:hypothetical protein